MWQLIKGLDKFVAIVVILAFGFGLTYVLPMAVSAIFTGVAISYVAGD